MGRSRGQAAKEAALADLARIKREGVARTSNYDVHEQTSLYDIVDEDKYADIAARERAETRKFLASDREFGNRRHSQDGPEADQDDDEADDLEDDFFEEDETSILYGDGKDAGRGPAQKKRRNENGAPRRVSRAPEPRRVASAFLGGGWNVRNQQKSQHRTAAGNGGADDDAIPDVPYCHEDVGAGSSAAQRAFDPSQLEMDHQNVLMKRKAARATKSSRRNTTCPDGDLLFDSLVVPMDSTAHPNPSERPEPPMELDLVPHKEHGMSKDPPHAGPDSGDTVPPVVSTRTDNLCPPSINLPGYPRKDYHGQPSALRPPTTVSPPITPFARPMVESDADGLRSGLSENGPLAREANGDLLVFWTDLHDVRVNGGEHVYLFGKAPVDSIDSGIFTSVCIQIRGLERALYVLPRHDVVGGKDEKIAKVQAEVTQRLLSSPGTSNLPTDVKAKVVMRSCPFGDRDAPRQATEYLQVKFPFENALTIGADASGAAYQRVYGTKTSASETLCIKQGLKGPSWLRISGAEPLTAKVSHARHTLVVSSPKSISLASDLTDREAPAVSVLCVRTKSVLNSKSASQEIVMLCGVFVPRVPLDAALDPGIFDIGQSSQGSGIKEFVLICSPDGRAMPYGFIDRARTPAGFAVEIVGNESALLNNFLGKLLRLDPDAVVGHDILGFGLELLLSRMAHRRTRTWSCLGRLVQRRDLSSLKNTAFFKSEAVAGRLVVDTYLSAKEISRQKDYSLSGLSVSVLEAAGPGDPKFVGRGTAPEAISGMFETTETLCRLVTECSVEARTTGRLAVRLNVLPLSKQLTCISGNIWSRTLQGARAQRIEALLCHEYKLIGSRKHGALATAGNIATKLLLPDKLTKIERGKLYGTEPTVTGAGGRRKAQYAGGLVLEPKKGFYDRYCLQLDFNSLYPSIIQEYNICFTTIDVSAETETAEGLLPDATVAEGVLPRVLRRLVTERRQVKALMSREVDDVRKNQLNIRQQAIKLTANSLYGCLGFENSRFFAQPLAALVTLQGRETLQRTVEVARDAFGAQVIYGDTDSLFVNTGSNDIEMARMLGSKLKSEINRRYSTLSIEIDAIYSKMLLLRKKTYAAISVNPGRIGSQLEVKGLALVRHDWCDLSHVASEYFLQAIFKDKSNLDEAFSDIVTYLEQLADKVRRNQVELSKFVITKSLTKDPAQYPDANSLPHVQVALRLRKKGRRVSSGEFIQYVICKEAGTNEGESPIAGNASGLAARAFHPDELVASNGSLVLDTEYYLENQVLPPIMRLCEPIDSVDGSRLASALGLDSRKYARQEAPDSQVVGQELFSDTAPVMLTCLFCNHKFALQGVVFLKSAVKSVGLDCEKCRRRLPTAIVSNAMSLHIRQQVKRYYSQPFILNRADGIQSRHTSRNVTLCSNALQISREFDEARLYKQLRYAKYLVDADRHWYQARSQSANTRDAHGVRSVKVDRDSCPLPASDFAAYDDLLGVSNTVLDLNGYRLIDLSIFLASLGLTDLKRNELTSNR